MMASLICISEFLNQNWNTIANRTTQKCKEKITLNVLRYLQTMQDIAQGRQIKGPEVDTWSMKWPQ